MDPCQAGVLPDNVPPQPPRFLDQVRQALKRHDTPEAISERSIQWITRCIHFHQLGWP